MAKEKLEKDKQKWENKNNRSVTTLEEDDIADVIASWTKIPVKKITEDENEKLKHLEDSLHKRVVGQKEAVEAVAKSNKKRKSRIKRSK